MNRKSILPLIGIIMLHLCLVALLGVSFVKVTVAYELTGEPVITTTPFLLLNETEIFISITMGLIGLILIGIALFITKCRARWFFWYSLIVSILMIPTILGIISLAYVIVKRNEFKPTKKSEPERTKKTYIALATAVVIALFFLLSHLSAFQKQDTYDLISRKWAASLSNCVSSADQLVIFDARNDEFITSVSDISEINELVSVITINVGESYSKCFCGGDYRLIFKQGTNDLATVRFFDDEFPIARLRFKEWPSDGVLTLESSSHVYNWLENHNIKIANQRVDPTLSDAF
jgi:TRAP-type C4-dicarboxylate transport system permease small subunit